MLGSDWNGSFGVVTYPGAGLTIAIASNIEFNIPSDLVDAITRALGVGTHIEK